MSASRPKELALAFARGVDRVLAAVTRLGMGAIVWPVLIGIGLGVGSLGLRDRAFAHGLLRRRATLGFIEQGLTSIALFVPLVLLVTLGLAVLRRRRGNPRGAGDLYLEHLRKLALFTAAPLAVGLTQSIEVSHDTLTLAFAFIIAALTTYSAYYWLNDREDGTSRLNRVAWPVVVGVAAAAYAAAASYIAIQNHLAFNTGRSDLGYYMSVFRQSSQGIWLGCSLCGGGTHLTGHFDPILLFLSPFYLLYPFAETLLVIQALWLASGAIAVYLFTLHEVRHRAAAAFLAGAYLLYPALHGVQFFDFHSIALCIPLFVWLLYFLVKEAALGYFITLALVLLVREDMSLAIFGVAIYALFRGGKALRFGWITIAVTVVYFVVVKALFMGRLDPLNSGSGKDGYAYYYEELIPAGSATKALIGILLTDPGFVLAKIFTEAKADYVAKLLVPLLGLPLIARGRVMLGYGAALTLLASRPFLHSVHFQYSSPLVPFLFVLTAGALGRLSRNEAGFSAVSGPRLGRALSVGVFMCTLLCSWKFGGLAINGSFRGGFRPLEREGPTPEQRQTDRWLRRIARELPRGARVAASSRLLTHLGAVTHVFMLDDRDRVDFVIAGPGQRVEGRTIAQDVAAGYLHPVSNVRNLNLYKTSYPSEKSPHPRAAKPSDPEHPDEAE